MAILYDWYENPGESDDSEEKGLHPRIFLNGKVGTDKLCRMIHGRSSLSVGDVKNAFEMLAQICGEELREGREVHIEGLGYFAPILRSTQKVTRSTKNKWLKMELKTIGFRPDARLRGELVGVKGSRSKYARHSESLSEVEIDMRLKEYFVVIACTLVGSAHHLLEGMKFGTLFIDDAGRLYCPRLRLPDSYLPGQPLYRSQGKP